jgi:uncharacterized protein YjbI with pentapeptide repeats
MTAVTLSRDNITNRNIDEADAISFGSTTTGTALSSCEIEYAFGWNVAISDSDITTEANWTKAALRALYFSGASGAPRAGRHLANLMGS